MNENSLYNSRLEKVSKEYINPAFALHNYDNLPSNNILNLSYQDNPNNKSHDRYQSSEIPRRKEIVNSSHINSSNVHSHFNSSHINSSNVHSHFNSSHINSSNVHSHSNYTNYTTPQNRFTQSKGNIYKIIPSVLRNFPSPSSESLIKKSDNVSNISNISKNDPKSTIALSTKAFHTNSLLSKSSFNRSSHSTIPQSSKNNIPTSAILHKMSPPSIHPSVPLNSTDGNIDKKEGERKEERRKKLEERIIQEKRKFEEAEKIESFTNSLPNKQQTKISPKKTDQTTITSFYGYANTQSTPLTTRDIENIVYQYNSNRHNKLSSETCSSWFFPHKPNGSLYRAYQYSISYTCLFNNTFVCLPTGCGKTLIAAVVLYNYYKWYPNSKFLFLAPSKPLVDQQLNACIQLRIPTELSTKLTGTIKAKERQNLYLNNSFFFATPQTIIGDINTAICPIDDFVCVIVDEAHRTTGKYDYVNVVNSIMLNKNKKNNGYCRIVALSATPFGKHLSQVQDLIDNLYIQKFEYRGEEDPEISRYMHDKVNDVIIVSSSVVINNITCVLNRLMVPYINQLSNFRILTSPNPNHLFYLELANIQRGLMAHPPVHIKNQQQLHFIQGAIGAVQVLVRARDQLTKYGIYSFYREIRNSLFGEVRLSQAKEKLKENMTFIKLMEKIEAIINNYNNHSNDTSQFSELLHDENNREFSIPNIKLIYAHPKLLKLEEIVLEHFTTVGDSSSKVMIFTTFRDSVDDIFNFLSLLYPLVKCARFVGQANTKNKSGLNQKEQKEILELFKSGEINCVVSTSIGEEGLDIGEIDLGINFDITSSPIRLVQRGGRTGRRREGRTVTLLTEGKEADQYMSSVKSNDHLPKIIKNLSFERGMRYGNRMLPKEIRPSTIFLGIEQISERIQTKPQRKSRKSNIFSPSESPNAHLNRKYALEHYSTTFVESEEIKRMLIDEKYLCQKFNLINPFYRIGHSLLTLRTASFENYLDNIISASSYLEVEPPQYNFSNNKDSEVNNNLSHFNHEPQEYAQSNSEESLNEQSKEQAFEPIIHKSHDPDRLFSLIPAYSELVNINQRLFSNDFVIYTPPTQDINTTNGIKNSFDSEEEITNTNTFKRKQNHQIVDSDSSTDVESLIENSKRQNRVNEDVEDSEIYFSSKKSFVEASKNLMIDEDMEQEKLLERSKKKRKKRILIEEEENLRILNMNMNPFPRDDSFIKCSVEERKKQPSIVLSDSDFESSQNSSQILNDSLSILKNRTSLIDIKGDEEYLYRKPLPKDDVFEDDVYEALEAEDTICSICSGASSIPPNLMLLCDLCNDGYHLFCLDPPLKSVPENDWFCPQCILQQEKNILKLEEDKREENKKIKKARLVSLDDQNFSSKKYEKKKKKIQEKAISFFDLEAIESDKEGGDANINKTEENEDEFDCFESSFINDSTQESGRRTSEMVGLYQKSLFSPTQSCNALFPNPKKKSLFKFKKGSVIAKLYENPSLFHLDDESQVQTPNQIIESYETNISDKNSAKFIEERVSMIFPQPNSQRRFIFIVDRRDNISKTISGILRTQYFSDPFLVTFPYFVPHMVIGRSSCVVNLKLSKLRSVNNYRSQIENLSNFYRSINIFIHLDAVYSGQMFIQNAYTESLQSQLLKFLSNPYIHLFFCSSENEAAKILYSILMREARKNDTLMFPFEQISQRYIEQLNWLLNIPYISIVTFIDILTYFDYSLYRIINASVTKLLESSKTLSRDKANFLYNFFHNTYTSQL